MASGQVSESSDRSSEDEKEMSTVGLHDYDLIPGPGHCGHGAMLNKPRGVSVYEWGNLFNIRGRVEPSGILLFFSFFF